MYLPAGTTTVEQAMRDGTDLGTKVVYTAYMYCLCGCLYTTCTVHVSAACVHVCV